MIDIRCDRLLRSITHFLVSDFVPHFHERIAVRPLDPDNDSYPFFQFMAMGNFTDDEIHKLNSAPEAIQGFLHNVSGRTDLTVESVRWQSYFR